MNYTTVTRTFLFILLLLVTSLSNVSAQEYGVSREFNVSVEISPTIAINTSQSLNTELSLKEPINYIETLNISQDQEEIIICQAEQKNLKIQSGTKIISIPIEIASDCSAIIVGDDKSYIPEDVDVNLLIAELEINATYL